MTRRRVILQWAGALLAGHSPVTLAQKPLARIAWLGAPSAAGYRHIVAAFKQGLRDNGMVEGRDYVFDDLWAEGDYERLPALARELLSHNPAVIVATTIAAVRAAQQATRSVPIVMGSINDPVGTGLIASLARPGGNTTGTSTQTEETIPKLLEVLHAVVPRAARIGVLYNPGNASNPLLLKRLHAVAPSLGLSVAGVEARTPGEIAPAFDALIRYKSDALMLLGDAMLTGQRESIAALALKHRLPSVGPTSMTDAGILLGYGASVLETYRRAASYVKRIVDGAKPADLPVDQPTRHELWVNQRTARALGIAIPQAVLLRADRVIE